MHRFFIAFLILIVTVSALMAKPFNVRIKDIVDVEGVRENQLVGYGIVVGLNGTGDDSVSYTKESLTSMLERMGINIRDVNGFAAKNTAAVIVTATLPPFAHHGTRIDVNVSAIGSAKDLKGGILLVTPLMAADGEVYAVAQGSIAVGGFKATGNATTVTKGVPTSGKISNGAIIEREIGFDLNNLKNIKLSLKNPDFTTSQRIAQAINGHYRQHLAVSSDPSTVSVSLGQMGQGNKAGMITEIEQLTIIPDQVARVVIDDHDGVVVMGEHVRVSTVAVSHGSITIKITETPIASQPNSFTSPFIPPAPPAPPAPPVVPAPVAGAPAPVAPLPPAPPAPPVLPGAQNQNIPGVPYQIPGAATIVLDRTDVQVNEKEGKVALMESGVSLQNLVNGLNALGASPRDLITILQSIKAAGALQADIQII